MENLDPLLKLNLENMELIAKNHDLRKMVKELVFQFEGLVSAESDCLDDDIEALFLSLLRDARKMIE